MLVMADRYQQLLEATIRHLEDQKAQGANYIPVCQETLAALGSPSVREPNSTAALPSRSSAEPLLAISIAESRVAAPPTATAASPPASPTAGPLDFQTKEVAMADLRARATVCQKCPHLAASRRNVVFGVGAIDSPLMFV